MNLKIDTPLKSLSTMLIAVVGLVGAFWFFGRAPFNEKVDERIQAYLDSPAMTVYVQEIRRNYELEKFKNNSKNIGLRTLLSTKMGVDGDEVHIELGKKYKEDKALFKKIMKSIDQIKIDLKNHNQNHK